jgi:hypothetical protein
MSGTTVDLSATGSSSTATARDGPPRVTAPHACTRRVAVLLSALVAFLMLVASAAGLLVDGLYHDPPSVSSMLRAYDLVTLAVVVPALAACLVGVRRRSLLAEFVWVGLLAATVYTYAIYVFGTTFNDLFLVHVAASSGAIFALIMALVSFDAYGIARRLHLRTSRLVIAVILAVLALGLGGMWIVASLRFATTGDIPAGSALVETDGIVHLGIALDLALLVPTYATAAVLVWRRSAWGYVLAAVVLVSGVVHQIGYLLAMPFQAAAGVPGAVAFDAAEPVVVALFVAATALLLVPLGRKGRGAPSALATSSERRRS